MGYHADWGSGLEVKGLGSRGLGLAIGVWGLRFRVKGLGSWGFGVYPADGDGRRGDGRGAALRLHERENCF